MEKSYRLALDMGALGPIVALLTESPGWPVMSLWRDTKAVSSVFGP